MPVDAPSTPGSHSSLPASPPSAPGTAPAPQPSDPPGDGGNGDQGGEFFDKYKALTGEDLAGQFESPDQAMRSLHEARKLVGRRDDSAQNWQRLIDSVPEERRDEFNLAIEKLRKGETLFPEPAAPPPRTSGGWEGASQDWDSYADFERAASRLYDDQGRLRENIDPRFADSVGAMNRRINEASFTFARDPKAVIEPIVQAALEAARGELVETARYESRSTIEQKAMFDEVQRIKTENAEALFVNGDATSNNYTEFGRKVDAEVQALVREGMPLGPAAIRRALKAVQAEYPQPQRTREPNARSTSRPGAAPARQAMAYDEWLRQNPHGGTFEYLTWREEQTQ